jgi:hypothetical protein
MSIPGLDFRIQRATPNDKAIIRIDQDIILMEHQQMQDDLASIDWVERKSQMWSTAEQAGQAGQNRE